MTAGAEPRRATRQETARTRQETTRQETTRQETAGAPQETARGPLRGSVLSALLIGIGVMAAVDELVFHRLLGWHHFYDRATPRVGLLSDGLLRAAELVAVVGGCFWLADLRRRAALVARAAWGGFLAGAGALQVFDGVVDRRVLRVHQLRSGVDPLPYDLAWNLAGLALLACGIALAVRAGGRPAATRAPDGGPRTTERLP
ncbi:DUF2243 domain-containing protein [Nonomuraea indica]|uniref:DUF2243 domain-containing protein n=1 Tax=Nonomuraea indica TaxID=1581193 RepID=UPI000C7B8601|nr:DUF2243 domain-containing protein [Nonomuraea indica]